MQDYDTARLVYEVLEEWRWKDTAEDDQIQLNADEGDEDWNPPVYGVRLDATEDNDNVRQFRIRAWMITGAGDTAEDFSRILDLAEEHDLNVFLTNNGIELT
jgi:hypothetical protein